MEVKCQNCGSKCKCIISFGNQPICNRNLSSRKEFSDEKRYPLGMYFCPACYLIQQPQELSTKVLFPSDFNYLSSSSKAVVEFYEGLAIKLYQKYKLKPKDTVVEVASNDGVFLKPLYNRGLRVIGIDPAKFAADWANARGIYTIDTDFESAEPKVKEIAKGKIKLLAAFDVLAHTGNLYGFLDSIADLLAANPDAIFVSQSQYLPKLMENCEFDCLYHEHQRTYTITSLQNIFIKHHLYIYDCEETPFYGGSILAYASCKPHPQSERLIKTLEAEKKYAKISTYKNFKNRVKKIRKSLLSMLKAEKQKKHFIIGIGQPMKSSVLLNYCKINSRKIAYLTETNVLKIGTLSPGSHIKVINENSFLKSKDNNPNTTALILSWNMADLLMKKLKENGFSGKFIIPIPIPKLVN